MSLRTRPRTSPYKRRTAAWEQKAHQHRAACERAPLLPGSGSLSACEPSCGAQARWCAQRLARASAAWLACASLPLPASRGPAQPASWPTLSLNGHADGRAVQWCFAVASWSSGAAGTRLKSGTVCRTRLDVAVMLHRRSRELRYTQVHW